jgi:membrane protein
MPPVVTTAMERWKESRAGRTLAWYGARNGGQLCGGIAYSALFSMFAGLTIGWSIFSTILGGNKELRSAILGQLDQVVPGLIGDGESYMIKPDQLTLPPFSLATVVAIVVMLMSAIGVMGALRNSVRTMFDVPPTAGNAVLAKLGQLAGFVLLGVAVLLSAASSIASRAFGHAAADAVGRSVALSWGIRIGSALVGVVIDTAVVLGIIVLVAHILRDSTVASSSTGTTTTNTPATNTPVTTTPAASIVTRRDLIMGSLACGVVMGVLRWLGTTIVVGSAAHNALLAPFAAIITVLVLANFISRVLLYACAWMRNPPRLDTLPAEALTVTGAMPQVKAGSHP